MAVTLAKWTLTDYHRMTAAGILAGRSVELLNGEIVTMAPEGPEHAFLGDEGGSYLRDLLGKRAKVREGRPITLANQSEPEPDLAVVKPLGNIYRQRHPFAEDVWLVIEFSNTSLAKDLDVKRYVYATVNIPEYWVVNLKEQNVVVFRNPEQGDYRSQRTFNDGDVPLAVFPDVTVSISRLLKQR